MSDWEPCGQIKRERGENRMPLTWAALAREREEMHKAATNSASAVRLLDKLFAAAGIWWGCLTDAKEQALKRIADALFATSTIYCITPDELMASELYSVYQRIYFFKQISKLDNDFNQTLIDHALVRVESDGTLAQYLNDYFYPARKKPKSDTDITEARDIVDELAKNTNESCLFKGRNTLADTE